MPDDSPVLLDTDAFSRLYVRQGDDGRAARWRRLVMGRTVVIAVQTRAELLTGSLTANWGPRRHSRLLARVDPTPTLPADRSVADEYARLTAELSHRGHGMHQPKHAGDRWIAATALVHGLPLLTGDGIYRQVAGLELLDSGSRQ